ncbi:MAG: 50S ribosomal protein L10 [Planctomycetota bacterium]|jgi:ribosomal protein L10
MSKPVKEMVRKELARRFEGLTSLAVVGFTGLDAVRTNEIRSRLREKEIKLTVVKNSLARQAFKRIGLEQAAGVLDGPCAVAYGGEGIISVVRELMEIGEDSPELTVKAAMLDGEVFQGDEQVAALSRFPTLDEARGQIVGCAISVAAFLAGCLVAGGSQTAALISAIEQRAGGQAAGGDGPPPSDDSQPPGEAPGEAPPEQQDTGQA